MFADARVAAALGGRGVRQASRAPTAPRSSAIGIGAGFARTSRSWLDPRVQRASTGGRSAPTAASRSTWCTSCAQGRLLAPPFAQPARARPRRRVRAGRARRGAARRRRAPRRVALPGRRRGARWPPASRSPARRCGAPGARRRAARSPTSPGRAPIRSRCRATAPRCCSKTAEFPLRALREAQRSGREWLEQRPLLAAKTRDRPTVSGVLPILGPRSAARRGEGAGDGAMVARVLASSSAGAGPGSSRASPASCRRADRDWSEPVRAGGNGRYYVFFKEMRARRGQGAHRDARAGRATGAGRRRCACSSATTTFRIRSWSSTTASST